MIDGLIPSAGEQTSVIQLEVCSAMYSIAADIQTIRIAGHHPRQLMAMVLCPCRREDLRNLTGSGLIRTCPGLNRRGGRKHHYDQSGEQCLHPSSPGASRRPVHRARSIVP
jgi:hypothetical protein